MTAETSVVERLLKRDRAVTLASLGVLIALAWLYLVIRARAMGDMDMGMLTSAGLMSETAPAPWTLFEFATMFVMWAVMMVGMMIPSAAPMILLFAALTRKSPEPRRLALRVGAFTGGYIVAWSAFSLLATSLQWGLERLALLSPMMVSTSAAMGGVLLIAAGAYQLTPLKRVCLKHCQSPVGSLTQHWRPGTFGALRMGVGHGIFCVGCCWVVMGLLFVGGVMNLFWIAAIGLFVLIEKLAPFGQATGRIVGAGLLLAGGYVLIT